MPYQMDHSGLPVEEVTAFDAFKNSKQGNEFFCSNIGSDQPSFNQDHVCVTNPLPEETKLTQNKVFR